ERLDVRMTVGAVRRRAKASAVRRFPSARRREFPTIDPGRNSSSAPLALLHASDGPSSPGQAPAALAASDPWRPPRQWNEDAARRSTAEALGLRLRFR